MRLYSFLFTGLFVLLAHSAYTQHSPVYYDVILCLDDRLTIEDQVERDKEIIRIIFQDFENMVRRERFYINSNDAFRLLIAPQKGSSIRSTQLAAASSIDLTSYSVAQKRTAMDKFKDALQANIDKLYDSAFHGLRKSEYNGANVWRYFASEYRDEMKPGVKHKIFILTDGHIDFEDAEKEIQSGRKLNNTSFIGDLKDDFNWENTLHDNGLGLLPCNLTLQGAELYVLEINPKSDAYFEAEVLKKVWSEWLFEMGAEQVKTIQRTPSMPDPFYSPDIAKQ